MAQKARIGLHGSPQARSHRSRRPGPHQDAERRGAGEVDPNNEAALKAATQEAMKTAVEAYRAAVDFVSG
jgi:hypothetical protein